MRLTAGLLLLLAVCQVGAQPSGEITIDSLHIRSEIRHRFSETRVTSRISNNADIAQDATFDVRLPDDAFISGYSMLIGGVVYPGTVKEKSAANKRFNDAVRGGESAGKVAATSARETNEFVITVNVAAHSHVTFNLTYQELLQRRLGLYEHVIHINPAQVVPDLRVEVFINETRKITQLSVPEVRDDKLSSQVVTDVNQFARIQSLSPSSAQVTFSPTQSQQQEYSDRGVEGQFIVNYDVQRPEDFEGEILVADGYFVHFFAPENLPPIGKRIVFMLDTSGSMSGRKNLQLREALLFILGQLRPFDEFSILLFSSAVQYWGSGDLIFATAENVDRAKQFARSIGARGGTNINAALLSGLRKLSSHVTKPSMLLFLTDGQATVGETNSDNILENVSGARQARQSIYSLAFGTGADFELLRKLSAQNEGFARKIFEHADAALQLAGFYNEISSPLLSEVQINYISGLVNDTSLTRTSFNTYFRGSEIVVAGRYNVQGQASSELSVVVEGSEASSYLFRRRRYCFDPWYCRRRHYYHYWCRPRPWPCPPPPPPPPPQPPRPTSVPPRPTTFIERLWVYLTIRQLVETVLETDNPNAPASKKAKAEAVRLSLKYQFVTPYTSMVATKPKNTETRSSFGPSAVRVPSPSASVSKTAVAPGPSVSRASSQRASYPQSIAPGAFRPNRPATRRTKTGSSVNRGAFRSNRPATRRTKTGSSVNRGAFRSNRPSTRRRKTGSSVNRGAFRPNRPATRRTKTGSSVNRGAFRSNRPATRRRKTGSSVNRGAFRPNLPGNRRRKTGSSVNRGAFPSFNQYVPPPKRPATTRRKTGAFPRFNRGVPPPKRPATTRRKTGAFPRFNQRVPPPKRPATTRRKTARPAFSQGVTLPSRPTTTQRETLTPVKPQSGIPSGLGLEIQSPSPDITDFSLCLDIFVTSSVNESELLLLSDAGNDLVVTATLNTEQYGDHRKFESVSVRLNGSDTLTVAVTSVRISNTTYRWWQLSSLSVDDVVFSSGDTIELTTPSNVSLVFKKYGIQTRRSLSSPFITVSISNTQNVSPNSTGVIGSVLQLENLRLGTDNRLHFVKDGTRESIVTSPDTLSDGGMCQRISDTQQLAKVLDI